MSTSKVLEYGIRWPNGSMLPLKYSILSEAHTQRNQLVDNLKRLGAPEVYHPRIVARIVRTETSDWVSPAQAEHMMTTQDDELDP